MLFRSLNAYLYPSLHTNVRRKDFPYYDTVTVASGTTEYYFFTTELSNQFLRNKKLPIAGSEVFFIESISAYIVEPIATVALIDKLNELLQQSYLQISIDNRVVTTIPGMDFIQYNYILKENSDQTISDKFNFQLRKLPLPIILNSNSSFEFKFVTTSAAATAFR